MLSFDELLEEYDRALRHAKRQLPIQPSMIKGTSIYIPIIMPCGRILTFTFHKKVSYTDKGKLWKYRITEWELKDYGVTEEIDNKGITII